jgi:L-serine dehydratase
VHEILAEVEEEAEERLRSLLEADDGTIELRRQKRRERVLLHARRREALPPAVWAQLKGAPGVLGLWSAPPMFHSQQGECLFESSAEMVALAEAQGKTLGEVALAYEAALLGLPERRIVAEVIRRYRIMRAAVLEGLAGAPPPMQLLRPSAGKIYQAEAEGRVAVGGIHTRAAARAMAVMHVNGGMGVVCAAPTAGSAGTIPAVAVTLGEDLRLSEDRLALALLAAAGVGLVVAMRATFAAEVAGCQVEIGAAGAMAAAAVVEAAGGSARQATDAAAIAFQNTMGSVCDLVQGIVEVPCHTRNAAAASGAFVCADLIMGGYENPIPLDETVDAVFAVGQMLPRELKVTGLGGLAMAPSARALPRLR